MTVRSTPASDEVLELHEFVEYVSQHVDLRDEQSLFAAAPKLAALARNRRMLATLLVESVTSPAFQAMNTYLGPAFILASRPGFIVRALAWPPADRVEKTPSGNDLHVYDAEGRVAHNHDFTFLTVGYWGPGYETDLYECEPDELRGEVGQKVALRARGRERLDPGRVMLYRAHRDVHVQYPAPEYSISINLLVLPAGPEAQYHFDVREGAVIAVGGTAVACRRDIVSFAGILRDPTFMPHLERIAEHHPVRSVRDAARDAVERFDRGTPAPG